jgi:poly(3-hydroxybutyrate) depolymerase
MIVRANFSSPDRFMRSLLACAVVVAASAALTAQSDERDQRFSLTSNGRDRSYRVFVPDGFGKGGPGPAVVLFNGSGSAVDGLLDPWKDIARKDGVLLIGQTAFAQGAWRIPEDSPDFTQEVIESAATKFAIDPRRVYLFGHSGGAGHALLLGLLESEYFAAVGAHAGALRESDRPLLDVPKRKIPMAIWVGTKDQMVPLKMVRDTLAILTSRGFPARVSEIPGHTHSYGERAKEVTDAAWEFLRKETLPADPKFYRYPFKSQP